MWGIRSPPHFISVVKAPTIVHAKNHHRRGHVDERKTNAQLAIGNKRNQGRGEQSDHEPKGHVGTVLLEKKLTYARGRLAAA